jgi:hypothetical protein
MAGKHWKRSNPFFNRMCELAMHVMGQLLPAEKKEIARLLTEQTTDSSCMVKAGNTEPVFTLRAKDPIAGEVIATWIEKARARGLHGDKIADAQECLKEFLTWKP